MADEQIEVGTAVAEREAPIVQAPVALPDVTRMMDAALSHGAEGVEALERLVDMQMRLLDRQAESALVVALAAFKAGCPEIKKTKQVKYATANGKAVDFHYAPLGAIQKVIDPELHRVGLSYTFDTEDTDGKLVKIRGRLQHVDGASRESSVTLPVAGMQDSPAQRYAGTITYGKRYVLAALLGITIEDDVDGQQPGDASEVINAQEFDELTKLIADTGADTRRFCSYLGVASLEALPSYRFTEARRALQAKGAKPDA
jgi:hypothetical protein